MPETVPKIKMPQSTFPRYRVRRAPFFDRELLLGDERDWHDVAAVAISHFRPESSEHRPQTTVRLQYEHEILYGMFTVRDRYVRCVNREFGAPVYKDSCVEFFVQPTCGSGYFNFEFNCGGAALCSYITDPARVPGGFREFVRLPDEAYGLLGISHSLPSIIEPETDNSIEWCLGFGIPLALLEEYTGPVGALSGQRWKANFYKCGDETSHPHWASWSPVDELNFHLPRCFGTIEFE